MFIISYTAWCVIYCWRIILLIFFILGGLYFVVNGPEFKQFPVSVKGSVFSGSNHQELFHFGVNKFQNPHDIAISQDGKTIFVVEISPFKIWKYESSKLILLNEI